jgi:hypothetical protein
MNRRKSPAALLIIVALIVVVWSIFAISDAYIVTETRRMLIREIRRNGGEVYEVLRYQNRDHLPQGRVGLWRWLFGDTAYGAVVVADEPYSANTSQFSSVFPEAALICTINTLEADTIPVDASGTNRGQPWNSPR